MVGCGGTQTTRITDGADRVIGSNRGHAAVKNLQSSRMSNFAETLVARVSSHLYQTFIAN